MGTYKQLMAVQHFSVEIDLHTSKNMRLGSVFTSLQCVCCCILNVILRVQVEFNKAAQSLTDPATILTAQKRNALNRLIKVIVFYFFPPSYLCILIHSMLRTNKEIFSALVIRMTLHL